MENDSEIIPPDAAEIRNRIYTIRGKQVMLDSDLAELYGYEVKRLNEQVRRNKERFPEDFMFQLAKEDLEVVKSQIVTSRRKDYEVVKSQFATSRETGFFSGQEGGRRKLPYAFTEQGIYMLSTVLRGELAVKQSIFIMRAFREMRHFIANNAALFDRISKVELKQLEYQKHTDERFDQIFECIGSHKETNQKLFFDGQIYDAFSLLIELIQKAEQEIILIDGYVDVSTLNLLAKKQSGVSVTIYTFKKTKLTAQDIATFNAQYPQLDVKYTNTFHDRFLILDGKTVYHIGASLKDAGKKSFAVMQMKNAAEEMLEKLKSV